MKINIYQINPDRDTHNIIFMNYESLEQFQGSSEVDSSIYDKIYVGDVPCENLEEIYRIFNLERPDDFRGHSLSVSDVVEVVAGVKKEAGYYFCDSFGYKKIPFKPELCGISERINVVEEKYNGRITNFKNDQ